MAAAAAGSDSVNGDNARRYELAFSIVDLAYLSTDTIDRGRRMYHLALVEYCRLLRADFYRAGALESVLLLLSVLGHDARLLGLVDFVVHRLEHHPDERIAIRGRDGDGDGVDGGGDDRVLLEWMRGHHPPERTAVVSDLPRAQRILVERGARWWRPNNFFVPLFLWSIREQAAAATAAAAVGTEPERRLSVCRATTTSAELGGAIERNAGPVLPVLRALSPDSRQRWTRDEASELLALPRRGTTDDGDDRWEEGCLLFWEVLRDAFAYTPGAPDALEETIGAMDRDPRCAGVSEEPPGAAGFAARRE